MYSTATGYAPPPSGWATNTLMVPSAVPTRISRSAPAVSSLPISTLHLQSAPDSAWVSAVAVEDLAQPAREGLRLAGVAGLAAYEAAVMAGEHGRLLTHQLCSGLRRPSGECALGLLTDSDHDPRRGRGQGVEIGAIAADRPRPVRKERVVTPAVVLSAHSELGRIGCRGRKELVGELSPPRGHRDESGHACAPPIRFVCIPKSRAGLLRSLCVRKHGDQGR